MSAAEGWKPVPTKLTAEMLAAWENSEPEGGWGGMFDVDNAESCRRQAQGEWDAMLAASPATPAGDWQSIETAPKDGSWFIADGGGLDRPTPMKWNDQVGAWECDAVMLEDWDAQAEGYSRPLHWWAIPSRRPSKVTEASR